ncbi:hypothetical protein [Anaerococcus hydrogenalis]|uniref:Conserved domain protein n=1 Tax=Anaerococcus hydrogenalis ACS-025-V-Sch4 TaxID=879306 RepID=F0H2A8_9FIRM|nr:hypothetical protein [Anaerococcus hydrogenalis]EGC83443.1 conserved domain protein [Anaerococcus hydrogenalis ACS-025-V-Sch4]
MRINENLLLNNDKLSIPNYETTKSVVNFKNGRIYFNNLNSFISNMTVDNNAESLSQNIDLNATYYVGVYGKSDKTLRIYKGETYKIAKTIGDFHYIEMRGDKIKGATYILSNESANGYIYALGIYKDFPSDIYIPNKNSVKADNQAVFLSGGYFRRFFHSRSRGGALC